jgi:hopene-associated glycosyltransferase HpnB
VSAELLAVATLAIWFYLILGRGFFWLAAERDDLLSTDAAPATWPSVTAIIPARNEADVVGSCIDFLLRQNYPGRLDIVLVDDESTDETATVARSAAARAAGSEDRLTVLRGSPLPAGWTGKAFAMSEGFRRVVGKPEPSGYVLFTDADISYEAPDAVKRLVRGAEARGLTLTSLMVKLRCESFAERLLVPALVFFFDMLYPFAWVGDRNSATAAASGGCMLVQRAALSNAGGIESIKGALIDDCALGAVMKRQGPIWLGLTERVVSLRAYPSFHDIRRMVVRSAFAELRYSPWRLLGALAGMVVTYIAPPFLAIFGGGFAQVLGGAAWLLMAISFQPTLRLYRCSPLWGLALPAIAAIYTGFTIESAVQHWRGRGGAWKGRFQAAATSAGRTG